MKKKGSALVFSVLILSFFLAISLNIFFQARKKAERAGVKVNGERITNNIDIASSLGYQELKLAEEFVRIGFLLDSTHPGFNNLYPAITPTDSTPLYIDPYTGEFEEGKRYAGVQINNFIDYFSSHWDSGGTSTNQKLILGEEYSGGKLISRTWQSNGVASSVTPLWQLKLNDPSDTSQSIGGYTLVSEPVFNTTSVPDTAIAIYEKFILLDEFTLAVNGEDIDVPQSVFRIEIEESLDYTNDGTDITISGRSISDFIIEAIDTD